MTHSFKDDRYSYTSNDRVTKVMTYTQFQRHTWLYIMTEIVMQAMTVTKVRTHSYTRMTHMVT